MTIKTLQEEKNVAYFGTMTCFDWLHLFDLTNFYSELYKWLNLLKYKYGFSIIGFVFMPNHLHYLLFVPEQSKNINKIIGAGKRFMAYEIINRLEQQGLNQLLAYLSTKVPKSEKGRNKKHQVFSSSLDLKPCYDQRFLLQKLDYIHHNPVLGKWNLVEDFTEYAHSSAKFYEKGISHPKIEITHFKDLGF